MVLSILQKRRSIRSYRKEPVEKEKVDMLIEAMLRSPSSKEAYPWEFIVIDDRTLLETLSKSKQQGSTHLRGAALGIVAVLVRQELVLFIMGGVFVMETVSVILQVASFKLTGKRIFRMAPLHHHFELKGWPEPRVIVRFWIVTVILVLVGLATLKLR